MRITQSMGLARPPDKALMVADRLLSDCHVPAGALMRQNVATCLYEALGRQGLRRTSQQHGPLSIDSIRANLPRLTSSRWIAKVERELKAPYQDAEVFSHLQDLEENLGRFVSQLHQACPGYPYQIYVAGSVLKGRLGKNSDLDVYLYTDSPAVKQHEAALYPAMDACKVTLHKCLDRPEQAQLQQLTLGPTLNLGNGQALLDNPHLLSDTYRNTLTAHGFRLSDGPNPTVLAAPQHLSPQRETNRGFEKFWDAARPGRPCAWMGQAVALSLAVPGLGTGVTHLLRKLVPSNSPDPGAGASGPAHTGTPI